MGSSKTPGQKMKVMSKVLASPTTDAEFEEFLRFATRPVAPPDQKEPQTWAFPRVCDYTGKCTRLGSTEDTAR